MNKITQQLNEFADKYRPLISIAIKNMRLLLLVGFAVMSGYLVLRVNSLVNKEPELPVASTDTVSQTEKNITKRPDSDVLSVFQELVVQDVTLDSNFEQNRQNPF
jgi:hypothetical protein